MVGGNDSTTISSRSIAQRFHVVGFWAGKIRCNLYAIDCNWRKSKNLDKATDSLLLLRYPSVDWRQIKGMRDVISHHYFNVDAEVVYTV